MRNIQEIIREVLEDGYVMSLGTYDPGGVWVCDLVYVFDNELNIYWLSKPDTRHSLAILTHPQVAGTITVSKSEEEDVGIQFSGDAGKVEGDIFPLAVAHAHKRGKLPPKADGDILKDRGQSWYKIVPKKIELIYEPLFDFEKKVV